MSLAAKSGMLVCPRNHRARRAQLCDDSCILGRDQLMAGDHVAFPSIRGDQALDAGVGLRDNRNAPQGAARKIGCRPLLLPRPRAQRWQGPRARPGSALRDRSRCTSQCAPCASARLRVTVYLWLRYSCSNWGMVTSSRSRSIASCEPMAGAREQPAATVASPTKRAKNTCRILTRTAGILAGEYGEWQADMELHRPQEELISARLHFFLNNGNSWLFWKSTSRAESRRCQDGRPLAKMSGGLGSLARS